MFDKLSKTFNRGTAQDAPRQYKPTNKKKNTYIVRLNTMSMHGAFSLCKSTPLVVDVINGEQKQHGAFASATSFPNPGAAQIDILYHTVPEWRIILGEKNAQTIIEYLDKESGQPALMLYPNGRPQSLIPGMDPETVLNTRLNHASRRDCIHQYNRIIEMVKIVNPLIDARNQAMRHAPSTTDKMFNEFMNTLNRRQIDYAHQIIAERLAASHQK